MCIRDRSGTASGSTSSDNAGSVSVSGSVSISGNCGGQQIMYANTSPRTISIAQMPAHQHSYDSVVGTSGGQYGLVDSGNAGSSGTPQVTSTGSNDTHNHNIVMYYINGSNFTFSGSDSFSASGSPSDHDHTFSDTVSVSSSGSLDLAVQYVDVIICTKS